MWSLVSEVVEDLLQPLLLLSHSTGQLKLLNLFRRLRKFAAAVHVAAAATPESVAA